ncbi:MAG: hypothetical protein JSV19_05090 [Phycisphaerales bacterium]|nr:MAG: hypothetical protein JSV19_05090 [Phycisphaerales bacterium]
MMPVAERESGFGASDPVGAERAGLGGLSVLALVSAYVLLASPEPVHANRHFRSGDGSPAQSVAVPEVEAGVTAAPAVTTPSASVEFPPPLRDPMVLATAVLAHHRLVVISLRGGLHGP